jgi:hypothetical protein
MKLKSNQVIMMNFVIKATAAHRKRVGDAVAKSEITVVSRSA